MWLLATEGIAIQVLDLSNVPNREGFTFLLGSMAF
jgi:hypothetical protein